MSPNTSLSKADLEAHLEEQIAFLTSSAAAFDGGFDGEAKRLAVTLRVLLHDTSRSHSLLAQLGRKDIQFLDTALESSPDNLLTHGGLVFIALGSPRTRYVAMLDDLPVPGRLRSFTDWWERSVFIDNQKRTLSRKDLVLTAANQDGGAHVDPSLNETYAALSKKNSLAWQVHDETGARPMEGPERAAIRQICHEVLKSIVPAYAKKPSHKAGVLVGGMSLKIEKAPPKVGK